MPITIQDYVQAAAECAQRTRTVTVILFIITTLAGAAWWNSREHSWLNARVQRSAQVLRSLADTSTLPRLYGELSTTRRPDSIRRVIDSILNTRVNSARLLARMYGIYTPDSQFIPLRPRNMNDIADVRPVLTRLNDKLQEERNSESFYLRISPLGLTFDQYDLPTLSGFSFLIILLLLAFSLIGELDSLLALYNAARETDDLSGCYNVISMRHVLAAPYIRHDPLAPETGQEQNANTSKKIEQQNRKRIRAKRAMDNIRKFAPLVLLLAPLGVHLAICIRYLETNELPQFIDYWRAKTWIYGGILTLVLVLAMAWCMWLYGQINKVRAAWLNKLQPPEEHAQG